MNNYHWKSICGGVGAPRDSIRSNGTKTQDLSNLFGVLRSAVAAPSMKAAAEAWGSRTNVFKQGFATETRDPGIVGATMAKPGVVLRRPVGSNGPFTEHAELPKDLPVEKVRTKQGSTNGRKWRTRAGTSRRRSWRLLCVERLARFSGNPLCSVSS